MCSGRRRQISCQVKGTVSIIGLHLSSQSHGQFKSRRQGGGKEGGREITDGTVMKIGGRIMSLVVSLSLITQADSESSFTVCCLLKKPEYL